MSGNPIFAILWTIMLWILVWPVAGICAGVWIFIQPFEACIPQLKSISNFLERLVTWPRDVGHAIQKCQQNFPAP